MAVAMKSFACTEFTLMMAIFAYVKRKGTKYIIILN